MVLVMAVLATVFAFDSCSDDDDDSASVIMTWTEVKNGYTDSTTTHTGDYWFDDDNASSIVIYDDGSFVVSIQGTTVAQGTYVDASGTVALTTSKIMDSTGTLQSVNRSCYCYLH